MDTPQQVQRWVVNVGRLCPFDEHGVLKKHTCVDVDVVLVGDYWRESHRADRAEATLAELEGLVGRLPKWDQLTITHFEADLITKLECDPSEASALAGLLRHRQEQP